MTTDDYLRAWATASRDEADEAWNALFDALHPAPEDSAVSRMPIAASHGATTSQEGTMS